MTPTATGNVHVEAKVSRNVNRRYGKVGLADMDAAIPPELEQLGQRGVGGVESGAAPIDGYAGAAGTDPIGNGMPGAVVSGHDAATGRAANGLGVGRGKAHPVGRQAFHVRGDVEIVEAIGHGNAVCIEIEGNRCVVRAHVVDQEKDNVRLADHRAHPDAGTIGAVRIGGGEGVGGRGADHHLGGHRSRDIANTLVDGQRGGIRNLPRERDRVAIVRHGGGGSRERVDGWRVEVHRNRNRRGGASVGIVGDEGIGGIGIDHHLGGRRSRDLADALVDAQRVRIGGRPRECDRATGVNRGGRSG